MMHSQEPQLDQSIQRYHSQSIQRSHSRLRYLRTSEHLPLQCPLQDLLRYLQCPSAPPATPRTPPVVPATSEPHPSESSIAVSILKFRGLCHTLQTLTATQSILTQQMEAIRTHQDQLIATQTQHTTFLR